MMTFQVTLIATGSNRSLQSSRVSLEYFEYQQKTTHDDTSVELYNVCVKKRIISDKFSTVRFHLYFLSVC